MCNVSLSVHPFRCFFFVTKFFYGDYFTIKGCQKVIFGKSELGALISGVGVYFMPRSILENFMCLYFAVKEKFYWHILVTTFFHLATEKKSPIGACLRKLISDPGLFLLVRQKHVLFCVTRHISNKLFIIREVNSDMPIYILFFRHLFCLIYR